MAEKEYIVNDNVIISEEILRMSSEERLAEIARLEKEHLEQRKNAEQTRKVS